MDPLACIYRTAMDVLTILRELEESAHVSLSDDAYDASSDHSSQSRVASPAELSDVPTHSSFPVLVMHGWSAQVYPCIYHLHQLL
jgi:hypothetical protein